MSQADEEQVLRRWKIEDEQQWQRISMPLAAVREFREVVTTTIYLYGDDSGHLTKLLVEIGSLEGRLLREAWRRYKSRTLEMLILDQRRSWRETTQAIQAEGNYRLASEIGMLLPRIKHLVVENFIENIEDS
jgi:hypothetical protein